MQPQPPPANTVLSDTAANLLDAEGGGGFNADQVARKIILNGATNTPILGVVDLGSLATAQSIATIETNLQSQIDLWSSPSNGITQMAADARYQNNFNVLLVSSTSATPYSTVTEAYANAISGDTIRVGKGLFPIGNFNISKAGVSVRGASEEETILSGTMTHAIGASNVTLSGFTLINTNPAVINTWFSSLWATDDAHLTMKDINIISTQSGAGHVFECSGDTIYLENVKTFATNTNHGHPFVIKGAKNVRSANCSSSANGSFNNLLIKSDSTVKGNCENIFVSSFKGVGASAGLRAESITGSTISNLVVTASLFSGCGRGVAITSPSGTATNNRLINSSIDVSVLNCASGVLVSDIGASGSILKVSGNCFGRPLELAWTHSDLELFADLDIISASTGLLTTKAMLTSYLPPSFGPYEWLAANSVSCGTASNLVRRAEVTDGGLYVVLKDSAELSSASLSVGDPIWVSGGALEGVYRLLSWGDVITNDAPIAGAVANDQYILMTKDIKTNGVYTSGSILPGKVHGRIVVTTTSYVDCALEIESWGSFNNAVYFSGNLNRGAFRAGLSYSVPSTTPVDTILLTGVIDIKSKFFRWGNDIYVAVFGGATANDNYLPSIMGFPKATVKVQTLSSTAISYKRETALPE